MSFLHGIVEKKESNRKINSDQNIFKCVYICIWNIYMHPKNSTPRAIEAQWGVWEKKTAFTLVGREVERSRPPILPQLR